MSLCRAFLWPGDSAVVWSVGAASVRAGLLAAQYFQTGRVLPVVGPGHTHSPTGDKEGRAGVSQQREARLHFTGLLIVTIVCCQTFPRKRRQLHQGRAGSS